ncbi:MAG: TolC family protein [Verrucomicrobia bacterium]|nr:TolC family protein [Verrucomicrobiota bacterium]
MPALLLWCVLLAAGCSSKKQYHAQADKDAYGILTRKEQSLFGSTNAFTVDTPYSQREARDIRWEELLGERKGGSGRRIITLDDALRLAVTQNRTYQFRKEALYLAALTLTGERHEFAKRPFASLGAGIARERDGDGRVDGSGSLGFSQLLTSGGTISATLANDMLRYFTGDPRRSVTTVMSLNFTQPLLRGAGADVVAEVLRQAEREVIYDLRTFALFQQTFVVDIVTTYYRLLQREDTVRNAKNNYLKLVKIRELLEAQFVAQRRPKFEVDQAQQEELKGKSAYISSVEAFQTALDQFKITLGLPLGVELALDDKVLDDLKKTSLLAVETSEDAAFAAAVEHKLDLLNEIDRFEDSKRKIVVAADRLKANLTFVSGVSLANDAVNYSKFDVDQYTANAGLRLDLPFDRLLQRNSYRATLIIFERALRSLALALDSSRDAVRQGLRNLEQLQQTYSIQTNALALADQRVNASGILLQAGRAQIRDQLEAQTAQVQAQNAVTQVLVDYLAARLKVLVDVGALRTEGGNWWLKPQPLPAAVPPLQPRKPEGNSAAIAPTDKISRTDR